MLCHFLIGIPASGKSTFAQLLAQTDNYQIISTDTIRQQLYGDETIQGNWLDIEAEVITQIQQSLKSNIPVIYDATNVKRAWRMDLLAKIEGCTEKSIDWLAWYLNLDVNISQEWNSQRIRQVPENIINNMAQNLKQFPPHIAEGFIDIKVIEKTKDLNLNFITNSVNKLKRIIINRHNKTQHQKLVFHPYSRLVDFERLMHLISLLINYPALGNLQFEYPYILAELLGENVTFNHAIDEITAIMAKLKGNVYAERDKIIEDLEFLQSYQLVHQSNSIDLSTEPNHIPTIKCDRIITHYASDKNTFQRILNTIKTIINYPFLPKLENDFLKNIYTGKKTLDNSYLTSITFQLIQEEHLKNFELKTRRDLLRKDIEFIFKPYQILPPSPMRNGYFFGTGILTKQELQQTFALVQNQANNINDPLALELYQKFADRLQRSKLGDQLSFYPVKEIANRSFIDNDLLDSQALSNKITEVIDIIEECRLVKLNRFANRPNYNEEQKDSFDAWLLQIVFYNFAWYLGFEHHGGKEDGLMSFERLDRLYFENKYDLCRSTKERQTSFDKLKKLLNSSAGIYLGNSVEEQTAFLSNDKEKKKTVEVKVELHFQEEIFSFIVEGTKRFPKGQMKMSKPPNSSIHYDDKSIYSLDNNKDELRPYRFQVILPQWSLNEFDFLKWILGFGDQVKVVQPKQLRDKIIDLAQKTLNTYHS